MERVVVMGAALRSLVRGESVVVVEGEAPTTPAAVGPRLAFFIAACEKVTGADPHPNPVFPYLVYTRDPQISYKANTRSPL